MSVAFIKPTFFDENGNSIGGGGNVYCPHYLDWMPIRLKAFWFTERGFGEPNTKYVLLQSQGEQLLVEIKRPLQNFHFKDLQEIDNGLEARVVEFARQEGISRVPRNQ